MNCESENTHMIMILITTLRKPQLGRKELVKEKCYPNVSETLRDLERQRSLNSFNNYSRDNFRTGKILTGIPENIRKPKV